MATLKKILIYVPSNLCDNFKSKYVTAANRNTKYDSKVVFLEKTQEIFTQGKLYGTTFKDFNDLKTLVGTLPSDSTSKNLVDYIKEVKTDLIGKSSNSATANTIYGAKKYADNAAYNIVPKFPIVAAGTGITVDASGDGIKTTYTVSTDALRSIEVLGYTFDSGHKSFPVEDAKTALGLGEAAYKNISYFDSRYDGSGAAADVLVKLPAVTAGTGISVKHSTSNGKTTYTISNSIGAGLDTTSSCGVALAKNTNGNIKVNVTPGSVESGNSSVVTGGTVHEAINSYINGLNQKLPGVIAGTGITVEENADGNGKTTYTVSNSGVTGVNTTSSSGVALASTNGTVKVNVTTGSITSGNGSVVTGGTVYTAISAAEGRCDAKGTAQNLINGLAGSKTSTNGSYVNVTVNTSKGQVSGVTVTETDYLNNGISKANSAVQSVSVLGKTLNKTTNSITVAEAKTALGLKSAAYKETSAFDAAGAASTVKSDLIGNNTNENTANTIWGAKKYAETVSLSYDSNVIAKFPAITNGTGITVTPTTDAAGKTTYKVSTSAEVFHYKGNKTALSALPSKDNTTGDVWSVGTENSSGSSLYAWDGDEWINIGGPNGVTGVDTTSSKGVALAKNSNGTVKVNVTPGSVTSGNTSVVTGGTVYTAIAAAEGRCDAKGTAQNLINGLAGSASSSNTYYVAATVTTSKGQVSGVTITETDALKSAVSNANSAMQSVSVLGKALNKTTNSITVADAKTALGLGTAAYKKVEDFDAAGAAANAKSAVIGAVGDAKTVNTIYGAKNYADYIASSYVADSEAKFPGVTAGTGITVEQSTSNGKTTYTVSTPAIQSLTVLGKALNKTTNSITVAEAKTALGLGTAAYKNEGAFDAAGAAANAKSAVIGAVGDAKTANTIYGAKKYAEAVALSYDALVEAKFPGVTAGTGITVEQSTSNGKTTYTVSTPAIQSISVLGKTLNKTTNSITVSEAKTALGLGTAAYKNEGAFDAAGAASTVKKELIGNGNDSDSTYTLNGVKKFVENTGIAIKAKFPGVTAGTGITVTSTTDELGKTTYTVKNSGVTGVNTTYTICGVGLDQNSSGVVRISVNQGEVKEGNKSVVTGGQVYTAIADAEGRCDAAGSANTVKNAIIGKSTDNYSANTIYGVKSYVNDKFVTFNYKGNFNVGATIPVSQFFNKSALRGSLAKPDMYIYSSLGTSHRISKKVIWREYNDTGTTTTFSFAFFDGSSIVKKVLTLNAAQDTWTVTA